MADRVEKVVYKVEVDTSGVPAELPIKQPPVPVERGGTPSPDPQKVSVRPVDDMERLAGMFARLMCSGPAGEAFATFFGRGLRTVSQQGGGGNILGVVGNLLAGGRTAGTIAPLAGGGGGGLAGIARGLGAGGAAAGGGALAAAGPVGLALGASLLLMNQVREASQKMMAGRNQVVGGMLSSDPSGMMKGQVAMATGGMHAAPFPLGMVADKLNEKFGQMVDILDKLVDRLGKYNGAIAQSQAVLEAHQIMADKRMADAMAPMLSQWNKLKTQVVDFGSKLAAAGGKLLGTVVTPFEKLGTWVMDKLNRVLDWMIGKWIETDEKTQVVPRLGLPAGGIFGGGGMGGMIPGAIAPRPAGGMGAAGPIIPGQQQPTTRPTAGVFQSGTMSATVSNAGWWDGWQRNPLFHDKREGDVPMPRHGVGIAVPQWRYRPQPMQRPNGWESDFQARQYSGPHGADLRRAARDQAEGRWTPWDTTSKDAKTASATAHASAEVNSKGYAEPAPPPMRAPKLDLHYSPDVRFELQNNDDLLASVRDMTHRLFRNLDRITNEADHELRLGESRFLHGGEI